jgi:hypothetical protein
MESENWWRVYSAVLGGIAAKKFQVAYTERGMDGDYLENPAELDLDESDFGKAADAATRAVKFSHEHV